MIEMLWNSKKTMNLFGVFSRRRFLFMFFCQSLDNHYHQPSEIIPLRLSSQCKKEHGRLHFKAIVIQTKINSYTNSIMA